MPIIPTDKVLRPRDPHDFYPTPYGLALAALEEFGPARTPTRVLDPGAGTGVWGQAVRARYGGNPFIEGVELRSIVPPTVYDSWVTGDYLAARTHCPTQDLIIGNPPYKQAEAFVRKAYSQLAPGGWLIFLLRLAFLEGQARGAGLWHELTPQYVGVCSQRPSFTGDGKTDATAYAVYVWQRGAADLTARLCWLDWDRALTATQGAA